MSQGLQSEKGKGAVLMKIAKKIFIYLLGFFIIGIGVNISKTSSLGISPVSSVPYALELIWGIELGNATVLMNSCMIILQIILLRRNYKIRNLFQFLPTILNGIIITYTSRNYLLFWLPLPTTYAVQLIYLFVSIVFIGIGISFFLIPNIMPLPPAGFMQAVVIFSKDKLKFGNVKVFVDSSLVAISGILSLVYLGQLKTVREGTILAALLIGKVVGFVIKNYSQRILEWFDKNEKRDKDVNCISMIDD